MSQVKLHLQSFNSGELSETMANRFGVEKVQSGCRQLSNMLPHVHGPVEKRPGMEFLGYAASTTDAPRLLEFNFSATTRFAIEFASGTFRIWKDGALVTLLAPAAHPYSYAESWAVQARQINDVLYLVHPNHHPRTLTRKADNDWVSAVVDWKYPPMLDEYFLDETKTLPVITPVWSNNLEVSPEFEVTPLTANENPWFTSEPSGVADSGWFQVSAGQLNLAATADCTLQVVNTAGEWVDAGTIPLSSGSALGPYEYSFKPGGTNTSLVVRRRLFSGGVWGAWATIVTVVLVLPSGSTVATMPSLQLRLQVGPVNRTTAEVGATGLNVVPVTGASGPLIDRVTLSGYQSYNLKYEEAVGPDMALAWSMPPTVPSGRTMRMQRWNGTAWVTLSTFTLAASMATQTFRLRRSGADIIWEEKGATTYTAVTTVASTDDGPWTLRLYTLSEPLAGNVTVTITAPSMAAWHGNIFTSSVVTRAIEITPSAATDPTTGGVTVASGQKWQFFASLPTDTEIATAAKIILQRKTSAGAWTKVKEWALASQEGTFIHEEFPAYTDSTLLRALYQATGDIRTDGVMEIGTVTYPPVQETSVSVSVVNGPGRTMTASAAIFQAGHVGSFWQIAHRRDTSLAQIIGVVGKFPATKLTSAPIRVIGGWDLTTYGTWKGRLFLERSVEGNGWSVERTWTSNKDRNVIASGTSDTETTFRLRVEANMVGYAATGADVPRFVLEASDSRAYGIVKVTAFTSSTVVTVDVIRPLHSIEATTLWAEGAFSAVRGYPAALAVHEGRFWYGGTTHQPSALFASVSNDFNNFRRSTNDDGSFVVALAAETGSVIRWLSNADDALLIGTGGEEWTIRSNVEGQPLTPTNIRAGRRAAYSSAPLPAKSTQDATLFVQRNRRKIRQVSYSTNDGSFAAPDMTVLAPHVTDSGVIQFGIQQAPQTVVWCVLANGTLAAMTFEKEQNVFAWSVHETYGLVKSLCVLTGETSDEVYLSVVRNGRAMIERLDPQAMVRNMTTWQNLIFCDSAVRRTGPGTSFTAAHLPSRNVVGLADGVPFTATTNGSGVFTLAASATTVVVGLPFTSTLQPMRIEVPMGDGTAQARNFRVSRVGVRVIDSRSGQVADGPDGVFETLEYTGTGLFTGMVETAIQSRTDEDMNVVVKDSQPLPFTVAALVLKLDVFSD